MSTFSDLSTQAANLLAQALCQPKGGDTVERAKIKAALSLLNVEVKELPVNATGEDFNDQARHLYAIADAVDPLVLAIGEDAKGTGTSITENDVRECFYRPFFGAIDGNATFHLEREAESANEWAEEYRNDAQSWERARMVGVD